MTSPARIRTFLWFQAGQLDEVLAFYEATFGAGLVVSETNRMEPDGPLFTADFSLFGHEFIGMSVEGGPSFNDSVSISIECDGQAETDRLWAALTAEGSPGRCGWCTDKWGLSWQVSPKQMRDWLGHSDPAVSAYAWEALRGMGKIVIDELHH